MKSSERGIFLNHFKVKVCILLVFNEHFYAFNLKDLFQQYQIVLGQVETFLKLRKKPQEFK